jgi:hypothetical protein
VLVKSKYVTVISLIILCCLFVLQKSVAVTKADDASPVPLNASRDISVENLRTTISHLESYGERFSWEKQWETARWVDGQFRKLGLEVVIHRYDFNEKKWPNVVAKLTGRGQPEQIVMLIAHLDSKTDNMEKGAPGADDNGSGVAVILEVARVVRKVSVDRTIMFCIFSNEERGAAGSRSYAGEARQKGMNIEAVINLDVLGYNRPLSPFYWSAVIAHKPLKYKLKAIYQMTRNYMRALVNGNEVVKVAGREPNRELVALTSRVLRDDANLKVRDIVRNDCG